MPDYQIVVAHYNFTRWHNQYLGTNFSEASGVPTAEWNAALRMLNMEMVEMLRGGTREARYVLRATDGGAMARQTGLHTF